MDSKDNNIALSLSVKLKKQTEKQGWEVLEHAGWDPINNRFLAGARRRCYHNRLKLPNRYPEIPSKGNRRKNYLRLQQRRKRYNKRMRKQFEIKTVPAQLNGLKIGNANLQRQGSDENLAMIAGDMKKHDYSFVLVSETSRSGNMERCFVRIPNSRPYLFLGAGKDLSFHPRDTAKNVGGVGILVAPEFIPFIQQPSDSLSSAFSRRIFALDLLIETVHIRLISVYAKHNGTSDENKSIQAQNDTFTRNVFYDYMKKVIEKTPSYYSLFIGGDFNARVGGFFNSVNDLSTEDLPFGYANVGSYVVYEESNDNGRLLLDFAVYQELKIVNLCFPGCEKTFKSPKGKFEQIDHVLVRNSDFNKVLNCSVENVVETINIVSDHFLMVTIIDFSIPVIITSESKPRTKVKKLNLHILKLFQDSLTTIIHNRFLTVLDNMENLTPDQQYDTFIEITTQVLAPKVFWKPIERPRMQVWFEFIGDKKRFHRLDKLMKITYNKYRMNKNQLWLKKYQKFRKEKRSLINQAMAACKDHLGAELQKLRWEDRPKQFWIFLEALRLKDIHKFHDQGIFDEEGKLLLDPVEILNRWSEYCKKLYANPKEPLNEEELKAIKKSVMEAFDSTETVDIEEDCFKDFGLADFDIAMSGMQNHKAPGLDNLPTEFFKWLQNEEEFGLAQWIVNFANTCLRKNEIPDRLKIGIVGPIPKPKGDSRVCSNNRTITLSQVLLKILTKMGTNRLENYTEVRGFLGEFQFGFRKEKSRDMAIHSLLRILYDTFFDKYVSKPLYLVFIDMKKAFDMVPREILWIILECMGIPLNFVNFFINLHTNSKGRVRVGGMTSEESFDQDIGVKQGCVAAPLLFILFFSILVRLAKNMVENDLKRKIGISFYVRINDEWKDGFRMTIFELLYADDMVIMTYTEDEAQRFMIAFEIVCKQFRMEISPKTEVMVQQSRIGPLVPVPQIKNLAGVVYPVVESFKYLGVIHVPFQRSVPEGGCSNLDSIYNLEVARRLQVAGLKFYNFRYFLLDKGTSSSIKFKVEIFKVQVLTVLLSCSGVCVFSDKNIRDLESFYYQSLRKICGYPRRHNTPKIVVYEKCGVLPLEVTLDKYRVLWAISLHNFEIWNTAKILSYNNRASDGSVTTMTNQQGHNWDSVSNSGHLGAFDAKGSFTNLLFKTLGQQGFLRILNAVNNPCHAKLECCGDPVRWGNVPVDLMFDKLPPVFATDEESKKGVKDLQRYALEGGIRWEDKYLLQRRKKDKGTLVKERNQSVSVRADVNQKKLDYLKKSEKGQRKKQREISEKRDLDDKAVITSFHGNLNIDEWAGTVSDQVDILRASIFRRDPDTPLEFISFLMDSGARGSKTLMRKFSFPSKHVLHQIVQRGEWRCGSLVEGLFVQDGVDTWYIGVILSLAQVTGTCCILFADQVHFDFPLKDLRNIASNFNYVYGNYPSGSKCMAITQKGASCKRIRVHAGIVLLPVCTIHFAWFLKEKVQFSLE